jgi:uncharacterized protein (TIGR03083 family)
MAEAVIGQLDEVWRDIEELGDGLSTAEWSTATDCPGWTVQDNVAHIIGTERMLLGEQPGAETAGAGEAAHVRNDIGKMNEQWIATYRSWDGARVLDELRAVTKRRLEALRAMSDAEWDEEGFTPEGPGPYRQFMEIRVFDSWYHDQDIREALDRPGYLDGAIADLVVTRVRDRALGYVVGKKAAAPPESTIVIEVAGDPPMVATVSVPPEGRAVLLDAPPSAPTARIDLDRRTFTRLAGGRWSADHARAHGTVSVAGDTELANRVVENLAFTI